MKNVSKVQEKGVVVLGEGGWIKKAYEGVKRVLKSRVGAVLIGAMGVLGWTSVAEANERKESSVHFKGITGKKEVTFFPKVVTGVDIGIVGPGEVDVDLSELEEVGGGKRCLTQKVCAESTVGEIKFRKWDLNGVEKSFGGKCLDVSDAKLVLIESRGEGEKGTAGFVESGGGENVGRKKSLEILATVGKDLDSVWKRAQVEGEEVFDGSYEKGADEKKLAWSEQWRVGNVKLNRNLDEGMALHRNQIRADAIVKERNAVELKLNKDVLEKLKGLIQKSVMTETGEWKRVRPNDSVTAKDVAKELKDLLIKIEDDTSVKVGGSSGGGGAIGNVGNSGSPVVGKGGIAAVGGNKAWVVNFAGVGPNIPKGVKPADLVKGLDLGKPEYRNYVRKVMADTIKEIPEEDLVKKLLDGLLKSVLAESGEIKRVSPTEAVTPKEGAEGLRNLFDFIEEYRKGVGQKEKGFNEVFASFHNKVCAKMVDEIGDEVGINNLNCSIEFVEPNGKKAVKVFVDAPSRGFRNVLIVEKRDGVQKNLEEVNSDNYVIKVDEVEVKNIDEGVKKIAGNWKTHVLPPKNDLGWFGKVKGWWGEIKDWWKGL